MDNSILDLIFRGTEEVIPKDDFLKRLEKSETLKIKFGADPTAPDLHLGHTVVLRKLRVFQKLGHKIQLIIGDFTAQLGDPSGRSVTRPPLKKEEVIKNAETYKEQVFKILDPQKIENIYYNSEWLENMNFNDVIKLCSKYTVARMLERDDFYKRYSGRQPICIHEFLYPLIQGYDSVVLKSDLEIGGTDQKFNLLVGRDLQEDAGLRPQIIMTMPILPGTDGIKKMSKSYGNYIGLNETSKDMFGKLMSITDDLMFTYFELLTEIPTQELNEYKMEIKLNKLNPRDLKEKLAKNIVADYFGETIANYEADEFKKVFSNRQNPDEAPEFIIPFDRISEGQCDAMTIMKHTGAFPSNGEIKRLIKQGGLKINDAKVNDINDKFDIFPGMIVKAGKFKFFKLK
ncbi:MAG TPA: tyrosine--tRNA ligase [bacterium]|nr:tyrosine--tRNA ligase [bacterium]HPN30729.1 tyrosine--tRNA ligase [bacterium]